MKSYIILITAAVLLLTAQFLIRQQPTIHSSNNLKSSAGTEVDFKNKQKIKGSENSKIHTICSTPLKMELGQIDSQFDISKSESEVALQKAINEWHDATGRKWFQMVSGNTLKVNFLFDGRQSDIIEMEKSKAALEEEVERLNKNSNRSQDEINSVLARIDAYKNKYESAGEPIPAAQHFKDPGGTSIDVFSFGSKEQLHATLLHELGHAMGLSHLPQANSIMYAMQIPNQSDTHLSQYDIEAALSLCEQR